MKALPTLLLGIILLLAGCSDDPTSAPHLPLPPSAEGGWVGVAPGLLTLSLEMIQDGPYVSGAGTITSLQNNLSSGGSLSGSTFYPEFSVTFNIPGFIPIQVTGKFVTPTMIVGELNESGFNAFPITFEKQ